MVGDLGSFASWATARTASCTSTELSSVESAGCSGQGDELDDVGIETYEACHGWGIWRITMLRSAAATWGSTCSSTESHILPE